MGRPFHVLQCKFFLPAMRPVYHHANHCLHVVRRAARNLSDNAQPRKKSFRKIGCGQTFVEIQCSEEECGVSSHSKMAGSLLFDVVVRSCQSFCHRPTTRTQAMIINRLVAQPKFTRDTMFSLFHVRRLQDVLWHWQDLLVHVSLQVHLCRIVGFVGSLRSCCRLISSTHTSAFFKHLPRPISHCRQGPRFPQEGWVCGTTVGRVVCVNSD